MRASRNSFPRDGSEIETVAENHFGDEVVGRAGDADAQAEIDFPLGRKVQVNRRKNLVLLQRAGQELRSRPHRTVVFEATGDFFSEVVAELDVGRKHESLANA